MDAEKRKQVLHDLKRIAQIMGVLQEELDRLHEDIDNESDRKASKR